MVELLVLPSNWPPFYNTTLLSLDENLTDEFNNETFCPTANLIDSTVLIITEILYILAFLIGILGNALVLYVVLRFSKMQTVTNRYIFQLALADGLFLIGIPFLIATMNLGFWAFGAYWCKIYMTSTCINQFTSTTFLTIMSADRYVAVCHPISAPKFRTAFISKVISVLAWIVSAFLMLPITIYATMSENNQVMSCNILWPETETLSGQTAFILYSFLFSFFIPFVLITVFYILVIRKLRTVGPKKKSKEKKKSHRKVTKLVTVVIVVYGVCWLPYWITQLSLIATPPKICQSQLNVYIFLVAGVFSYANSAVNPILYTFFSDNFKKSFKKICLCRSKEKVNATLQVENSMFPKRVRGGSATRVPTLTLPQEAADPSKTDPSTTKSNATVTSEADTPMKKTTKSFSVPTHL